MKELDEEVAWKFEETRLTYNTLNTKVEILKCLQNEENIFEGIRQLFETCIAKGKKGQDERTQLLEHTSAIIGQLQASCIKQAERLDADKKDINDAKKRYDILTERKELYHRLLGELNDVVEENRSLAERMANPEQGGVEDDEE
jgi:hypothetical protein